MNKNSGKSLRLKIRVIIISPIIVGAQKCIARYNYLSNSIRKEIKILAKIVHLRSTIHRVLFLSHTIITKLCIQYNTKKKIFKNFARKSNSFS